MPFIHPCIPSVNGTLSNLIIAKSGNAFKMDVGEFPSVQAIIAHFNKYVLQVCMPGEGQFGFMHSSYVHS
jgi:hypothetical protein